MEVEEGLICEGGVEMVFLLLRAIQGELEEEEFNMCFQQSTFLCSRNGLKVVEGGMRIVS